MIAKIGDIVFTLKTPIDKIKRDVGSHYEKITYLSGKKQVFLIDSDEVIEISGTIYPYLGKLPISDLRRLCVSGKSYALSYMDEKVGEYIGKFFVEMVSDERSYFFEDGTPQKITFNLKLIKDDS